MASRLCSARYSFPVSERLVVRIHSSVRTYPKRLSKSLSGKGNRPRQARVRALHVQPFEQTARRKRSGLFRIKGIALGVAGSLIRATHLLPGGGVAAIEIFRGNGDCRGLPRRRLIRLTYYTRTPSRGIPVLAGD